MERIFFPLLIFVAVVSADPPPISLLPPVHHNPPTLSNTNYNGFTTQLKYSSRPFSFKSSLDFTRNSYPNSSPAPPSYSSYYPSKSASVGSSGYSYNPSSYYRAPPTPTPYYSSSSYRPYQLSYESGRFNKGQSSYSPISSSYEVPPSSFHNQPSPDYGYQPWKPLQKPYDDEKLDIVKHIYLHSTSPRKRKPQTRYKFVLVNNAEDSRELELASEEPELEEDDGLVYVLAKKPRNPDGHSQVLRVPLHVGQDILSAKSKLLFIKYKQNDEIPSKASLFSDYGISSHNNNYNH